MKLGVVFPHWAIKSDPIAIRDFTQTVEGLGYDYMLLYEHIVDTQSDQPPNGWHEPFTLIAYMAGFTTTLNFATGITVLPSRQTLLATKQAISLDVLTNGRFRLGVSVGWNKTEFQALGIDTSTRSQRLEEQIDLMRQLWTQPFVTYKGDFHDMENVGIYPRPVTKTPEIWIGGYADVVMRRIAKMGDGWMMYNETPESAKEKIATLHTYIKEAGRKPEDVALNIVGVEVGEDKDWGAIVDEWADVGVTYLDVATRYSEDFTWDQHMSAMRRFKERVDGK